MAKINIFTRNNKRNFSSLTLSLLISLMVVFIIHVGFVFPKIENNIRTGKEELLNQIKKEVQSATSIPSILDDYKAKGAILSITRISPSALKKISENQKLAIHDNNYYLIEIIQANFIHDIRLALFGSILLLFSLTFFFIRLIYLYIENSAIKKDLSSWENKINVIAGKINNIEPNLAEAMSVIQSVTPHSFKEWEELYYKSCEFDILLDSFRHKEDIITNFSKIKSNIDYKFTNYYLKHFPVWQKEGEPHPLFIMNILDDIRSQNFARPVYLLVFDSMRFDHWLKVKPIFNKEFPSYSIQENISWSLLPTYTAYCRNSLLAGKSPKECSLEAYHGQLLNNQYEELLFHKYLKNHGLTGKYIHHAETSSAFEKLKKTERNPADITALIYLFIDGLTHSMSHTRTDESLFREHVIVEFSKNIMATTFELIRKNKGILIITSDHGNVLAQQTIRVNQFNIKGFDQKENLSHVPDRFLIGQARIDKLSDFKTANTHLLLNPETFLLPGDNNVNYAFCRGPFKFDTDDRKRVYEYVHGGASITEILVPYIIMKPE
ncbi:MAG: hypothetical protein DKM50_12890 [Candidatus Margulisiibacteriota bacterium]|nr:MAG: hypothetical protein DKM50_12890 [Candidatus Margulisiibacteriota bacterium]HCY36221.1 hypothetical protein [Candidatus Margulisiibacteriota bacterium]